MPGRANRTILQFFFDVEATCVFREIAASRPLMWKSLQKYSFSNFKQAKKFADMTNVPHRMFDGLDDDAETRSWWAPNIAMDMVKILSREIERFPLSIRLTALK